MTAFFNAALDRISAKLDVGGAEGARVGEDIEFEEASEILSGTFQNDASVAR
jgi:hypothetical protein